MKLKLPFFGGKSEMATDPVCNMQVDTSDPPGGTAVHGGVTFYFCGPGCRVAFEKEPEPYLSGEKKMDMGH